jgi:hypothetical protein
MANLLDAFALKTDVSNPHRCARYFVSVGVSHKDRGEGGAVCGACAGGGTGGEGRTVHVEGVVMVGAPTACYIYGRSSRRWPMKRVKRHAIEGTHEGATLEGLSVRALTAVYRRRYEVEPTGKTAWLGQLGHADMEAVFARLTSPLVTPRDYKSYDRVLNRSLRTRNVVQGPELNCRLCGRALERLSHLAKCSVVRAVFSDLARTPLKQPLTLPWTQS